MGILHHVFGQSWTIPGLLRSVLIGIGAGLLFTQVTSLATTLGLHRAMTHAAYRLHPALNWTFRFILWVSVGIKWWEWCRVHKYHHMYTETEHDGHSPMFKGGISGVILHNPGLYTVSAHDPDVIKKTGHAYQPDKWDRRLFDREGLGRVLGIVLCVLCLGLIPGVIAYVVHIYAYIILNAAINSIGHGAVPTGTHGWMERALFRICLMTGERPGYDPATAREKVVGNSLNLQWLAWVTMGEGLHYNHHYRPRCATMRRFKGDHDPGLFFLRVLQAMRLVSAFEIPQREPRPTKPHIAA